MTSAAAAVEGRAAVIGHGWGSPLKRVMVFDSATGDFLVLKKGTPNIFQYQHQLFHDTNVNKHPTSKAAHT